MELLRANGKLETIKRLCQRINEIMFYAVNIGLIEWQLLTMRPNEAVGVKWQEIDFNNCLWIIPAEKMKMRREHTITLNKQAMALLSIMKPISGHREHIFPSLKPPFSTPMNKPNSEYGN